MNDFTFVSTKEQQRRHYLYAYFHRPILWFQRRFGGPFILALGIASIALKGRFDYFDALLVFFGIYYIVRPFIAAARITFKDSTLKAAFEDSRLRLSDDSVDWTIKREEALRLKIKDKAVFLKFKQAYAQWIIFNLDFLESGKAEFVKAIREFAGIEG